MKKDLHPDYSFTTIKLSDGSEFVTRTTMDAEEYASEIDSTNHPFYTGKRQYVDTAGRVEKFRQRYGLTKDTDESDEDTDADIDADTEASAEKVNT